MKKLVYMLLCCFVATPAIAMSSSMCCQWCSFECVGCSIDRVQEESSIVVHDRVAYDNRIEIAITVPDIDQSSLSVTIQGDQLCVSARLKQEESEEKLELFVADDCVSYTIDRRQGVRDCQQVYSASSTQSLPDVVDIDRAQASLEGNTLVLVLPKKVARKQVTILRKDAKDDLAQDLDDLDLK